MSEEIILNKGTTISIDQKDFNSLKLEFSTALNAHKTEFIFKGHTILTAYAKYLIEYLSSTFK